MNMIVMMDNYLCIGVNGDQPVHLKKDLARFQDYTTGKVVVYGKSTLDTFPNSIPLKNRTNIILSSRLKTEDFIEYNDRNVIVYNKLEDIYKLPQFINTHNIWIIGGASIYKQLIKFTEHILVTKVHTYFKGDNKVYFPTEIQSDFEEISRYQIEDTDKSTGKLFKTDIIHYRRISDLN